MILNVNTDALVSFTNKLEKAHKSALPVAIRSTLNDAVFDVKTTTMPGTSENEFENRQKNFFKANSKFIKAEGFNVNSMKSYVGFYENKLKKQNTNFAVKDLEKQEHGGTIQGKAFIPMKAARIGGRGVVKSNFRMNNMKDIIDAKKVRSISGHSAPKLLASVRKQKLIRAAIKASLIHRENAYVMGNPNAAGRQTVFKVDRFLKIGDKLDIKLTPIYNVYKNRKIEVEKTGFMQKASEVSANKMDVMYIKQATRQLKKYGLL